MHINLPLASSLFCNIFDKQDHKFPPENRAQPESNRIEYKKNIQYASDFL